MGRLARNFVTVNAHVALRDRDQPDQPAGQRRLANTVATEQRHHFARVNRERDSLHDR
jgi:hypothetical protein